MRPSLYQPSPLRLFFPSSQSKWSRAYKTSQLLRGTGRQEAEQKQLSNPEIIPGVRTWDDSEQGLENPPNFFGEVGDGVLPKCYRPLAPDPQVREGVC